MSVVPTFGATCNIPHQLQRGQPRDGVFNYTVLHCILVLENASDNKIKTTRPHRLVLPNGLFSKLGALVTSFGCCRRVPTTLRVSD